MSSISDTLTLPSLRDTIPGHEEAACRGQRQGPLWPLSVRIQCHRACAAGRIRAPTTRTPEPETPENDEDLVFDDNPEEDAARPVCGPQARFG